MQSAHVLIVEDDARLRASVARVLQESGLRTAQAGTGAQAVMAVGACATHDPFDVIVLDIGLPDADGRDVCQTLRANGSSSRILFLTARGQVDDELSAFAAGGDDFLAKPFHVAVLRARVHALTKRFAPLPITRSDQRVHLDSNRHALVDGDTEIRLTPTEFRIVAALIAGDGAIVRRHALTEVAWPAAVHASDQTLDQCISRIRRKLAPLAQRIELKTAHGVGYQIVIAQS